MKIWRTSVFSIAQRAVETCLLLSGPEIYNLCDYVLSTRTYTLDQRGIVSASYIFSQDGASPCSFQSHLYMGLRALTASIRSLRVDTDEGFDVRIHQQEIVKLLGFMYEVWERLWSQRAKVSTTFVADARVQAMNCIHPGNGSLITAITKCVFEAAEFHDSVSRWAPWISRKKLNTEQSLISDYQDFCRRVLRL